MAQNLFKDWEAKVNYSYKEYLDVMLPYVDRVNFEGTLV